MKFFRFCGKIFVKTFIFILELFAFLLVILIAITIKAKDTLELIEEKLTKENDNE